MSASNGKRALTGLTKSAAVEPASSRPVHCEALESRQLLSVSLLDTSSSFDTRLATGSSLIFSPATLTLPAIRGFYSGTYSGKNGTANLTMLVTSYTRNGRFTGTMTFTTKTTPLTATFSGAVSPTLAVVINFSGSGFTGSFSGKTTAAGDRISGRYAMTVGTVVDSGSFAISK